MRIAGIAQQTLQRIAYSYFQLVALLVAFVFPERLWYRALFRICRVQQYVVRPLLGLTRYRKDQRRPIVLTWLVESTLQRFIMLERPFPIPLRHKNLELVLDARSHSNGLVLCSVHLPFIRFSLLPLLGAGVAPTAVIAHPEALKEGRLPVWTTSEDLPGLAADRDVLFKVRTILRHGGLIATLIDLNLGDPLNTNMFRLIRSTGARVLFMVSELQPDGTILIEYLSPPDPLCLSNESVTSNLLFLQERTDRIMHRPPVQSQVAILPTRKAATQGKAVTLEADSTS